MQLSQFTVQKKNILILPKTAAGVLSPVILTGICFLLLFLTCGQIFLNRIPLLLYNGQFFVNWGGSPQKTFQFTTDIFSEKNRGLLENKNAPGLGKSGSIVICDMKFQRTASTAAVRTQRRNEYSGLSASLPICSCWEYPNPVDFMQEC